MSSFRREWRLTAPLRAERSKVFTSQSYGRKASLESRQAAAQFHTVSAIKRFTRNIGFKVANLVIRLFSRSRSGASE